MQPLTAIGITQKTGLVCTGTDLYTSDSGLFLDRLPGLGADWFAADGNYGTCSDSKSYLSRLVRAREEALQLVKEAIFTGLTTEHKQQKHTWIGYIGQRQGLGLADTAVLTLQTANYQDAHLSLTHIGVVASGEGTAIITLSYPGGETQTFTIPVEQTGYSGIPVALILPLDRTAYTFNVAVTGTVKLQKNGIGCGCGAKDTLMYTYVKFNNCAYASGISLTAAVKCQVQDAIDRIYKEDETLQRVFAYMLHYRAGVVLCDYILGNVTPQETDTDLEYIKQKRAQLLQEFTDRVDWVIESGMDVTDSACFACSGARVVSIG